MELRNQGSREVITATPRILESLIRISESLAKMELRETVVASDVHEAVRLLKAATYAAAVDPETGEGLEKALKRSCWQASLTGSSLLWV